MPRTHANDACLALRGAAEHEYGTFAQTLPDIRAQRSATDPLQRLHEHLRARQREGARALIVAETLGRRESLLDFLRASSLNPPAFDTLEEFQNSTEPFGIICGALAQGFSWVESDIDFITETELFAAAGSARRRRRQI